MRIINRMLGLLLAIAFCVQFFAMPVYADDTAGDGGGADHVQPAFAPKMMIWSYRFSRKKVYAGKEVTVRITLANTSNSQAVQNMMVTANIENEYMQLTKSTDSIFIPYIAAGGRYEIQYSFKSNVDTPPGQYDLGISMDYADQAGETYSAEGKVKIDIRRKAKVKFDPLIINSEAEIGDTIEATVNAMNLGRGKLSNVRAKIKADGLTPKGSIYIGDIEPGARGTGSVDVLVGALSKGEEEYGITSGTIVYYYEDEAGKEKKIKKKFSMNIRPLSIIKEENAEEDSAQWWTIVKIISGVLCVFAVIGFVRVAIGKKEQQNEQN